MAVHDDMTMVQDELEQQYQTEAIVHSLSIIQDDDPSSAQSPSMKECIREIKERLVHRWHFMMLNDMTRNSQYYKAITEALKRSLDSKPVVLDIGSGTSILSLMAVKGGAAHVHALDQSHVMIKLSRDIIAANQMEDKVTLLQKHSNDLQVLRDIPSDQRLSLVVMEIFDVGLLGEHVLPTLRHIWRELSTVPHPPPAVIPCGATVYISAIQSLEIRKKSRLLHPLLKSVTDGKGVRLFGTCKLSSDGRGLVKEPYHSEDLAVIRGGVVYLTRQDYQYHRFNFSDPQMVSDPVDAPHVVSLVSCMSGVVDAIGLWFGLHLDTSRTISTAPGSRANWEQAVYPVMNEVPLVVVEGDQVHMSVTCTDTHIDISDISTGGSKRSKMTNASSNFTDFFIERSHLCRLNDSSFIDSFISSLKSILYLLSEDEDIRIIEVSPHSLSLFSILLDIVISKDRFLLVYCSQLYLSLLHRLAVSADKIRFITELPTTLMDTTWDLIILSDLVTPQGTLCHDSIAQLRNINLVDSIIVPTSIEVVVTGISSPGLKAMSCVLGNIPTMGFDIAPFINKYQITHLTDVDLNTIQYCMMTDSITAHRIDLHHQSSIEARSKTISLQVVSDGMLTGLAYWFVLHLHGNCMISTGPNPPLENHWHQSVFMLTEDKIVTKDQQILVDLTLTEGYLDITLCD